MPPLRLCLTGAASHAAAVAACAHGSGRPVIVCVAGDLGTAERVAEETGHLLRLLAGAQPTARAVAEPDAATAAFEADCDLLAALAELRHGGHGAANPLLVAALPGALVREVAGGAREAPAELAVKVGDTVDLRGLAERLAAMGYSAEAACERPGEFALRGGILDVYPVNAHLPARLDCLGDTVEAIRAFDPATQRGEGELASVVAAALPGHGPASGSLLSHLPKGALLVGVAGALEDPALAGHPLLAGRDLLALEETDAAPEGWTAEPCPVAPAEDLLVGSAGSPEAERAHALRAAASLARDGRPCLIAVDTGASVDRAREESAAIAGFAPRTDVARFAAGATAEPGRLPGPLAKGLVLLTERELFARRSRTLASLPRRRSAQRAAVGQLLDFSELAEGDALVHATQGICLFRGIRWFEVDGARQEFLSLEFAEKAMLHLALRESHLLSRYVGIGRAAPRLSRLGGGGWERTRKAAEGATLDLAAELLRMQALRQARPGLAHPADADHAWMGEFERAFPHRETTDQARAIAEAKADMERASPMDRLVCGDVGFGKTEVALRAAFKCALGGRQVAVLAPTTVLAQQLHATFAERMGRWPVTVELLSSYRTPRQRAATKRRAEEGKVDIVVGTHALLAQDVRFARLGLAVVDEEHRFGVRHKEQLKRMRSEVDVLAMSATPIPRTLYLALVGARDLSVIETPPRERLPIRTVVRAYDERLVRDAIRAELARGGQVFYLHNRIETIEACAARVRELAPRARIAVGHGRMGAGELEAVMAGFVSGEADILVCTTIIETGLDIPNCNTLILEGADRLGLAQLYQIRGRVGRFNRQAYAYLFLHRHGQLAERARNRLAAVRQHNQLGAGFRIAMRDLELRGAGNLLGAKQSGHIAGVGFELYCQLLRESVQRLKGGGRAKVRAEVALDCVRHADTPLGPSAEAAEGSGRALTAALPASWIPETRLRIEAFRRIALAGEAAEVAEIRAELRDRFGRLPPEAAALLDLAELRCLAESRGVTRVATEGAVLRCHRLAAGGSEEPLLLMGRFPRLTAREPLRKLAEIRAFLARLPSP
ncbi:MAG: transcription-repair coupling factor [Opitutia bacterium]|jgi:transcription-repair coupling factor (superfamily II helicase)